VHYDTVRPTQLIKGFRGQSAQTSHGGQCRRQWRGNIRERLVKIELKLTAMPHSVSLLLMVFDTGASESLLLGTSLIWSNVIWNNLKETGMAKKCQAYVYVCLWWLKARSVET